MTKKKFYKMLLSKGYQRNAASWITALAARQRFLQSAGYGVFCIEDGYGYWDFLHDPIWLARMKYFFNHAKHRDQFMKQLREAVNNPNYNFTYC